MKKTYFLLLGLMSLTFVVNAQINIKPNKTYVPSPKNAAVKTINKTVNCLDTVWYPQNKATNYLADTMDYQTYIVAVSQNYYFTGNGLIHGISAYMMTDNDGIAGNSDSVSMVISVRNIAGGIPTTTIASDTVFVYDVGYAHQNLMFQSPVAVSDSFALVIEIDTLNPSNPYYITNDYGDGNHEALSGLTAGSTWYNIYVAYAGAWDVDMILSPIIEVDITSSYTMDKDTIYPNDTIVFTNTSNHIVDSMFNLFYVNPDPLYTWNFDDGTGNFNPFDTSHVYTIPGDYDTYLKAHYYGYTQNCIDSSSQLVHVNFALDVEENIEADAINIYPIPATKYFNVNVPNKYFGGNIIVTDVVGKTILRESIGNKSRVKVTTEGFVSGIYFVSVDYLGERVYAERIMIDK